MESLGYLETTVEHWRSKPPALDAAMRSGRCGATQKRFRLDAKYRMQGSADGDCG
ncbi:hypothetical protein SCLCIDRAFT_1220264 [Scleroderma citrinum Foug A]|uniref:Uncharacterized protein n=1 Tax=Scleroderma citrinum Foug A TaxID=1036808 RepID=A0A0C3D738_9AGAM|nr:hypothetical protein SCLCIDRAFT_1220264 [Scleroderma citrinum Foug A]